MKQWILDTLNFLFPAYCPVCGIPIPEHNSYICTVCESKLPGTGFNNLADNPVAHLFWGRVNIQYATSLFRFEKGSDYQVLLHNLKYRGAKRLGIYLGKLLGLELRNTPLSGCTYLVPVPLHRKKEHRRGYNQAEVIASGVSEILKIPVNKNLIYRNIYTESQTRKGRFERYQNMKSVIALGAGISLPENCHLLIIDDVVTTGSTLEACAEALLQIPGLTVSIATIACA